MSLLSYAVSNNVDWCALISRGGGVADPSKGVWLVTGSPAPLFPDAVTLRAAVSAEQLNSMLSDRPVCSVKDSFADVDLEPYGFRELFTGRWIGQIRMPVRSRSTDWSCIADPAELESWCAAAQLPEVLPPGLLQDRSVRVLAAYQDGLLAAGAIANRSDAVVGLSNVFQISRGEPWIWGRITTVVAHHFPGLPIVGYEHGSELDAALAAGFSDLGPVRVYLRS